MKEPRCTSVVPFKNLWEIAMEFMGRIDEDLIEFNFQPSEENKLFLIIDRIATQNDESFYHRLADAIDIAFFEGKGEIYLENSETKDNIHFSTKFEMDGVVFNEPNIHFFSFRIIIIAIAGTKSNYFSSFSFHFKSKSNMR